MHNPTSSAAAPTEYSTAPTNGQNLDQSTSSVHTLSNQALPTASSVGGVSTPWHADKYDALGVGVWRHWVLDDGGEIIAVTYGDQAEAHARRIALLPELVEMLRELVKAERQGNLLGNLIDEAEVLVAKATLSVDQPIPFSVTAQGKAAIS